MYIDTSMDVEVLDDDVHAMDAASFTNFDAGDVIGKLMAFVAQLSLCGESMIVNAWTRALFSLISGTLRLVPELRNVLDGLS